MKVRKSITVKPMVIIEIGLIVLIVSAGIATATIDQNTITPSNIVAPQHVDWSADGNVEVYNSAIEFETSGVSATGQSAGSEVEFNATPTSAVATEATSTGNYLFTFQFRESDSNAVAAGTKYKIEIYGDNTLEDTLYVKQMASPAADNEGVLCQVDVGTSIPEDFDINITQYT